MNFDLDDPLDGLLSDGSNDSLFGNETAKKPQQPTTTATTTKPETKQMKMEDLFGIKTDASAVKTAKPPAISPGEKEAPTSLDFSKPSVSAQPSSLSSFQTKKTSTPVKKVEPSQKKEITFDDSDVLSDLGFDPKKPKSKTNILDDILGTTIITSSKDMNTKQNKAKQSLAVGKEETAGSKTISRQSTETSENLQTESTIMGGYAPSGSGPRRGSRRKSSTAINDPLGLFSAQAEPKNEPKTVKKGADWLGLNEDSISNDPEPVPVPRVVQEIIKPPEVSKPLTPVIELSPRSDIHLPKSAPPPQAVSVPLKTLLKPDIATAAQTMELLHTETQNALNTMQQQEFHLMVANQMKHQEQALFEMQRKQQAVLQRQESQFNELLQKQIQRHNYLEEVMAKQQERINTNIQVMMTQPPQIFQHLHEPDTPWEPSESRKKHANNEEEMLNTVELKSDLKRLELEKLRLEDLVSNITANHEQEVTLLEQSYRKQMAFLEESLKIMETRMKLENKNLEDFYKDKLQSLEAEKQRLLDEHAKQTQEMEESHRKTIEKLRISYEESVRSLKAEHVEMINNIRESKMLEFSVLQDNQSYMSMLKNASNYLESASGDIQQLRDTLQEQIEFSQKEKEIQLKAREKQLEDQQRILERTKVAAETEKVRLLNLVEMLEGKLTDLSKTSSEEHWNYQQKLAKLDSEKQSLDKEKEHARERILREEKRIEELKQSQLEEHNVLRQKIENEKQLLLEEKAKLETLSKIQRKDSTEISRAEIEAAIKVAEDAAHQSDLERERLIELQRQFEIKKRAIINQGSVLRAKADALDNATSEAKMKELNAENAFKSVKRAEQNLQLKLQLIQKQFREISEREDRLSRDKIELSKERLELQAVRKRLQTTRCSLCKIGERTQEMGEYLTTVTNSEPVADDRKLEANFFELQHRESGGRLDNFFDSDIEKQLQSFLERNRVDDVTLNMLPNIAENEDGTIDTDLLLLKFDVLKSQSSIDNN
ncbi:fas-binding factor 1 [Toxorhynchites rutilus septentrionalis]|uniref:fas-binding factor 1 n=1 Tax=Toxorhynchites rutilus septentrionalis TaxID=329112 RepID=UPI00247A69CB|nr:fas-binding factor 1 [Toxorhynchites rutilus septentrionalis]